MKKQSGAAGVCLTLFLLSGTACAADKEGFRDMRESMVQNQIAARGLTNTAVLAAMRKVPRHLFVPERGRPFAYADHPLPIGEGQTISQPYIVALITELAAPAPGEKILEIGTGSGYQAAVLAEIVRDVFTIEILPSLAERAQKDLLRLGYTNIRVRTGDGFLGWPEEAPFDAIIVTCAPDEIPAPLFAQLKEGGRMVIPVGEGVQNLQVVRKIAGRQEVSDIIPVLFVPMTGRAREKPR